ncbi:translation initiation factor IF-2-like [Zalophus californianus]|uniref:Translation initiation factor IF-2-like n=1 Tax=Zalophus californianus TaxID=9704 RepID=A0A6J2C645_ZALCA|nr:translation initiation factor IF-2-like [Zalophus californianus]
MGADEESRGPGSPASWEGRWQHEPAVAHPTPGSASADGAENMHFSGMEKQLLGSFRQRFLRSTWGTRGKESQPGASDGTPETSAPGTADPEIPTKCPACQTADVSPGFRSVQRAPQSRRRLQDPPRAPQISREPPATPGQEPGAPPHIQPCGQLPAPGIAV